MKFLKIAVIAMTIVFYVFGCISCSSDSSISPESNGKEKAGIIIFKADASEETVTLKNLSGSTVDIGNWILIDKSSSVFKIPENTLLYSDSLVMLTLSFFINDKDESIYLLDEEKNKVDSWSN
jgi:hypothetical protein